MTADADKAKIVSVLVCMLCDVVFGLDVDGDVDSLSVVSRSSFVA